MILLLFTLGLALACDPDFEGILRYKCDSLPYRTISDKFFCAASTPIGFNCDKLAFNGGIAARILTSDSRAQQYLKQGFWGDANSQICEISWSGTCNGRSVQEDLCYSIEMTARTWSDASNDCTSKEMTLYTPHNDADLRKFWEHVRIYTNDDFWIGAATFGSQWQFSDQKTVDFFRLFPATFSNLNCSSSGNNGTDNNGTDWMQIRDSFDPLGNPDWSFLGQPPRGKRQITSCTSPENNPLPNCIPCYPDADEDLWPEDRANCSTIGGQNGSGTGCDGQLALTFHSKSQTHSNLGYTSVNLATAKFPYVCVKSSYPYGGAKNYTTVTTPDPNLETTTFRDMWPED